MAAQDQVVYLEKFVESTVAMPSELTRILNMIRDLDHKCQDLSQKVEDQVNRIAQIPSGKSRSEEVKQEAEKLKADQSLLIQWSEEKVQLAVQGHELLGKYAQSLEGDITNLTQFLTETGQLEIDEYMPDDYVMNQEPHLYESVPARRAGSSRLGYTSSIDGYEPDQPPAAKPLQQQKLRTNIPLTINRQTNSAYGDGVSSLNPDDVSMGGIEANTTSKRRRNQADGRRRSAAAAVSQATAMVAAAMYDDDDYLDEKNAVDDSMMQVDGSAQMQYAPVPSEPFIPGLKECAKKPQAARRRLTEDDITIALVGKIAEVYWVADSPEESMWYLVKVESVDLAAKTACVRYQNGEVEADLNLAEVAHEGHMLLV
ncbi:hypothetical protein M9434_005105 [Picochlorum sp. BPE23]|nr:hypothetical protein M9434_005105 [Picochlorum sp. BPE23]KAI8101251.1 hypothetical protein M9435_001359 [Picochlorum sp. BPE23]